MRRRGFTLIEILVTISVITIIALLALSPGQFWGQMITRAEVEKLRTICLYLRSRAILQGASQSLIFDPSLNSYTIDGIQKPFSKQIIFGLVNGVKGPPSLPTSLLKKTVTFPENRLTFSPDGGMSSGAAYFTDRGRHYQYALTTGVARSMCINIYRYTGAWHRIV